MSMRIDEIIILLLDFMHKGGEVMWLIALLAVILWTLVFERLWYLSVGIGKEFNKVKSRWLKREDHFSSSAKHIQTAAIARLHQKIDMNISLVKTLVLLCPLLGLLGTVSGMISVFDVIAFTSMGDVKLMANGVSRATIPTMASMVISISGLMAHTWLRKIAVNKKQQINEDFSGEQHA
jgi:biopolymer transport protein ExbB